MNHEEKEERRNMKEEEGWREGKDKRKEGGRAIGRGGEEEREGGRVGKKEGGRTEGIMEGCREGGIRNREHLGQLWGGSCRFWWVPGSSGRTRRKEEKEGGGEVTQFLGHLMSVALEP